MYEIERLFSEDLTKLTNEQLNILLTMKTDDNVLTMFTQTTRALKTKTDNDLTGIFNELILAEDHDKARRNEHAIKKAAIHTVSSNVKVVSNIEKSAKDIVNTTINKNKISKEIKNAAIDAIEKEPIKKAAIHTVSSNVEVVSNIEKSAKDIVNTTINKNKSSKAVGDDVTTIRLRDSNARPGLIPTFIDLSQYVTPIETAAIHAVNYAVEEGYERERLRMLEKNALKEKLIRVENYPLEEGYVNHYPRKHVGIENDYDGRKVICYANSVLQMFYSLPYYRTIISDFNKGHPISKLFNKMNNSSNDNFVSPEKIHDCPSTVIAFVKKTDDDKINVIQEDANQYLQYLLEKLPVDAVKFIETNTTICNKNINIKKSESSSNLSIPVVIQPGGSTINACIEKYSNEDMAFDKSRIYKDKNGIKALMLSNLDKTIYDLRNMIPQNDKGELNSEMIKSLVSIVYDPHMDPSTKIIDLLHIKNHDNTIFVPNDLFETYIRYNKVLYNTKNNIKSNDETDFLNGCAKYTESFDNIEEFKKYIDDNDDYLVVPIKKYINIKIPPENRYLVIHLRRFKFDYNNRRINKLTYKVMPDKTLSIDGITYTLSGVIFHIGKEYNSGHYMYIQCNQLGEYHILYDDDKVYNYMENAFVDKYHNYGNESIDNEFINNNGYLFSYSRYPVDQDVNKK
jgi:hypothetical protein